MFGTEQRLIQLQLLQPPAESNLWHMVRNTGSLERTYMIASHSQKGSVF